MPHGHLKRCDRTDALRFFAMVLVILTHLLNLRLEFKSLAPWLVNVMLAFNMPLFAFLSGYVLYGREGSAPLRFVRGKAKALLIPYVAWVVVEMPLRGLAPAEWLPRLVQALVDPRAGFQMWFLWVLFALFVVFVGVRTLSRSAVLLTLSAIASAVLFALPLPVVSGSEKVLWLYPFLVAGFGFASLRAEDRVSAPLMVLGGATVFAVVFVSKLSDPISAYVLGASGTAAAWALYRLIPDSLIGPQAFMGARTMGLYGLQMVVLPFLIVGVGWGGAALSLILVTGVASALTVLLDRWSPTRAVFLGKWPRRAVRP